MRRWQLSKKDRRRLLERLHQLYPAMELPREARIEKLVEEDITLYLLDGRPWLIELEDKLIPHLAWLLPDRYRGVLPYIVVDEGAVKPISRGADLMRPGVLRFEGDYGEGDIVVIVEPGRLLPLAVHEALLPRSEAERMEKGRITRSLHHVGDRFWKLGQQV
ncbi:MAG: DUF1947 domain-containing protein [Crenarchaeota archaeon]|nr:DUF1947 domain-containing protein [Thermoproteota archaeon]